ncbi:MAG TPA: TIR domain-containing protein [Pseudonocardiaceae bacterium]|nr:TIR domain-containing protein [Pseudonocardiaceae bacterium]
MARVFVSHASEDFALAGEVHQWLVDAGHEVFLAQDLRAGIAVGEEWEQRLHDELRLADAVVCVVTSAYLASRWCTAEVAIARSRGSRLLPVQAEPGVADPLLASVQHVDLIRTPDAVRPFLVEALHLVDAGWPDDRAPFPGLRPFEVDQHRVFFGRAEEAKELAELLRSPAEHAKGAALLVVGPSGCGKSSLVRAGLVPLLAGEPGWWTLPPIVPGTDPVAALTRELAAAAQQVGLDWTVAQVRHQLDHDHLREIVDDLLLAAPGGPRQRLLVVVDQFEEVLTQATPAARARFAELLRPALEGPIQMVAPLRPEFLDQLLTDPDLARLSTQVYPLRPLRRETLRAVIEKPARLAGIDVDEHLVARLVDDTADGEALPLLAFTLAQLAEGVSRGGKLSAVRYHQLGGVQGALTHQADAALAAAVAVGGRDRAQVIAGLLRVVTVDEQGRPTRWRTARDELSAPVRSELDCFVARRLLTTDTDHGTVVLGVAHEAFLSVWPPLAEAIAANVAALRARRAVEHAATEWHQSGRPRNRLWSGGQLAAAVTDTGRVDISPKARDFLHASIRRDRFRRRRASAVLSVLLILALVAAGVAVVAQRRAEEGQRVAIARQLIAQADATRDSDPRTALRLGSAAEYLHPGGETRASLAQTLTTTRYAGTLPGDNGYVLSVAFAPNGRTLATGSEGAATLWNLTDPAGPRPYELAVTGDAGGMPAVAFAPGGNILATGTDTGTVLLWDVTDPTRPRRLGRPLAGHTELVSSVAFAPDGRTLATASFDSRVRLWDLTDPAAPQPLGQPLTGHTGPLDSVAFAPDGKTLASGGFDGMVLLWDRTDPARPQQRRLPLAGDTEWVSSVAFEGHTLVISSSDGTTLWDLSNPAAPRQRGRPIPGDEGTLAPGGSTLATSSADGTVLLWDVTDPARPRQRGLPLAGHTDAVQAIAVAPDGRTLATGSQDGNTILWDLTDRAQPRPIGRPLTGHAGSVSSVAVASDGRVLATGSADGTVLLWDVTDPARPHQLGHPFLAGISLVVGFSPDGQLLATASEDGKTTLWDLADPAQPRRLGQPLTGHTLGVLAVAFHPAGTLMATGSFDQTAILWDVTDPARAHQLGPPLAGHTYEVGAVAFAPNGNILATGSLDRTVILWDVTNPTRPRRLGLPLVGQTRGVRTVTFDSAGNTLATGSGDGTVILWDVSDPARPRRLGSALTAHSGPVNSVLFFPDGNTLATGSDDRSTILWDLTSLNTLRDHAPQRACAITGGGLDRDEWARYLPELPYQDTCPH